ncbi:MAG: long-chain-acyl-CoA synthetase [Pseudomonadota bacterium]
MKILDSLATLTYLPMLLRVKKELAMRPLDVCDCTAAQVEATAARVPDHLAIVFEGQKVTWREFNELANRVAAALSDRGVGPGDVVSVVMENRIEFLSSLIALNKIGATGALINTNLRGRQLVHCITVASSKMCLFGAELQDAIDESRPALALQDGRDYLFVPDGELNETPNWAVNLSDLATDMPSDNPAQTGKNPLGADSLYIYTSGTTGLPKAAILSNRRHLMASGMAAKAGFMCNENDAIYICLPLYHGTGLMLGVGASLLSGAAMVLRRKFSASNFLPEVREHNATCFIYIGELCRYLLNTDAKPDDNKNPLSKMLGNGLRPDVWHEFKDRFGVKRICEFYGASEGNVSMVNLLNKDCTVGMTSQEVTLVRYDVDEDAIVRDDNGHAIAVEPGEPGLMLGKISADTKFEGYTDAEATEKKVERNLLADGDAWFNSGDLLRTVDVGYTLGYPHYQFVDRVGDTFRWKSENVSTNEVGEILNAFEQVKFCNVYGVEVPGADGRAGMAALTLEDETSFDVEAFAEHVVQSLPPYARPVFVRLQRELEVTGTFKLLKGDLRKQGYDTAQIEEPVYVMKPGAGRYEPLDPDYQRAIESGAAGF